MAILKQSIKGVLVIPIALTIILVPVSMVGGWNLYTLLLFWFGVIPILSVYLPQKVSRNKNHFIESLAGLTIFYFFIVLLIYKEYKTDFFKIMIASALVNMCIVTIIYYYFPLASPRQSNN